MITKSTRCYEYYEIERSFEIQILVVVERTPEDAKQDKQAQAFLISILVVVERTPEVHNSKFQSQTIHISILVVVERTPEAGSWSVSGSSSSDFNPCCSGKDS